MIRCALVLPVVSALFSIRTQGTVTCLPKCQRHERSSATEFVSVSEDTLTGIEYSPVINVSSRAESGVMLPLFHHAQPIRACSVKVKDIVVGASGRVSWEVFTSKTALGPSNQTIPYLASNSDYHCESRCEQNLRIKSPHGRRHRVDMAWGLKIKFVCHSMAGECRVKYAVRCDLPYFANAYIGSKIKENNRDSWISRLASSVGGVTENVTAVPPQNHQGTASDCESDDCSDPKPQHETITLVMMPSFIAMAPNGLPLYSILIAVLLLLALFCCVMYLCLLNRNRSPAEAENESGMEEPSTPSRPLVNREGSQELYRQRNSESVAAIALKKAQQTAIAWSHVKRAALQEFNNNGAIRLQAKRDKKQTGEAPRPALSDSVDWNELDTRLALGRTEEDKVARQILFQKLDVHKRGYLYLDDIIRGLKGLVGSCVPKVMWRTVVPMAFDRVSANDDKLDTMTQAQIHKLLVYIKRYLEIFCIFDQVDLAATGTLDQDEFAKTRPLLLGRKMLGRKGESMSEAEWIEIFYGKLDPTNRGEISFETFVNFALSFAEDNSEYQEGLVEGNEERIGNEAADKAPIAAERLNSQSTPAGP